MSDNNYETSLAFARKKAEQIKLQVPPSIRQRENSLFQKLKNSNLGRLKKLELLFSEMGEIYKFIHRFSICKKGCKYCCHYEIAITDLEVEYIKNKVKINKKKYDASMQACPFLKEGTCSIYEYRPFVCRRHLSIADTPDWCKLDICKDYNFPLIYLDEIDKCYEYLVGQQGMKSLKDIRQAFK